MVQCIASRPSAYRSPRPSDRPSFLRPHRRIRGRVRGALLLRRRCRSGSSGPQRYDTSQILGRSITRNGVAEVRRVRFGPGLWPGPRLQARRAGRGLRRSRVGPEDRFCGAVRNDLRVPLTLEWPARTMRGVPAPSLWPFARRSAHLARDDRPGQLAERVTYGALRRGAGCGGVSGHRCGGQRPRRCAPAQEEAGQAAPPPAARVPNISLAAIARHCLARSRSPCSSRVSFAILGLGWSAWRAEGAPLKPLVEKVVTAHGPHNGLHTGGPEDTEAHCGLGD
jgi:hypothetical protein